MLMCATKQISLYYPLVNHKIRKIIIAAIVYCYKICCLLSTAVSTLIFSNIITEGNLGLEQRGVNIRVLSWSC